MSDNKHYKLRNRESLDYVLRRIDGALRSLSAEIDATDTALSQLSAMCARLKNGWDEIVANESRQMTV